MRVVTTTFRPDEEIEVSDSAYEDLKHQGLIKSEKKTATQKRAEKPEEKA